MSSFRFKASHAALSANEVRALRTVCELGISEIIRRAERGEPLLDVPAFSSVLWPEAKALVLSILRRIEAQELPLTVHAVHPGLEGSLVEEQLGVTGARAKLQHLREIALEQDMLAQLESGEIASREQYVPLPEDEA